MEQNGHHAVNLAHGHAGEPLMPLMVEAGKKPHHATARFQTPAMLFTALAACSIVTAIGFSVLQEWVFKIPGFSYGGWMTFITYVTYAACGWTETMVTRNLQRHGRMKDYAVIALLAMTGAYMTNWALNYLNYTTRIVFKSSRVLPVMGFRTLVVGERYSPSQYCAGLLLVLGIALFTMGDAQGLPNFSWIGIGLVSLALVCDAMTANLEEKQFFRIRQPCSHAEVMLYLSAFGTVYSLVVLVVSGEVWDAVEHSTRHPETVPTICLFSVMGYATVSLILLIIKNFGATNAEIVKSLRKVCQVAFSFWLFPKPLTWKYVMGGLLVGLALYWLQRTGKRAPGAPPDAIDGAVPAVPATGSGAAAGGAVANGTSGGVVGAEALLHAAIGGALAGGAASKEHVRP